MCTSKKRTKGVKIENEVLEPQRKRKRVSEKENEGMVNETLKHIKKNNSLKVILIEITLGESMYRHFSGLMNIFLHLYAKYTMRTINFSPN